MKQAAGRHTGFTLVEVLAVIVVIGILMAVVVGVANQLMRRAGEKSTKLHMRVIMEAVNLYYEALDNYPNPTGADDKAISAGLYKALCVNDWGSDPQTDRHQEAARKLLASLPPKATRSAGGTMYFVDGFLNPLRYRPSGGVGGQPYLESPGADGDFGNDSKPAAKEDNIRSDKL